MVKKERMDALFSFFTEKLFGGGDGDGGDETSAKKSRRWVEVSRRQPSGRILERWPSDRDAMLEAVAKRGADAFLTDAEKEEIERSLEEKRDAEAKHALVMARYRLPVNVVEGAVFKMVLEFMKEERPVRLPPPPACFRPRAVVPLSGGGGLASPRFEGLERADRFRRLAAGVWTRLGRCVEDLDLNVPRDIEGLRLACLSIEERLLSEAVWKALPPDEEWARQLVDWLDASLPLFELREDARREAVCRRALSAALLHHGLDEDAVRLPERDTALSLPAYYAFSALWRRPLDVEAMGSTTSLASLKALNAVFDPSWIEVGGREYVRCTAFDSGGARLWLHDPGWERTAALLHRGRPDVSVVDWCRALSATVLPQRDWHAEDWSDDADAFA